MNLKKIAVLILAFNLLAVGALSQTKRSDCICPVVKIIEPQAPVKSGDAAVLTAQIKGDNGQTVYDWSVSGGVIVEGQGTPTVRVDTSGAENATITATVYVRGWCSSCENMSASASVFVETDVKPVLIDKFVRGNCEEVLARMDNFFVQLQNDPTANGYFIAGGRASATRFAEREARNWIKIRNFDASRITFVKGDGTNERAEIELWLVPPGANPSGASPQNETEAAAETVVITKPYIFGSKFVDGVEGCTTDYDLELYAETLKANPKARANVVIYETAQSSFRETEKEILAQLKANGIARKRIKTFYRKVKPNQLREGIELWYLP